MFLHCPIREMRKFRKLKPKEFWDLERVSTAWKINQDYSEWIIDAIRRIWCMSNCKLYNLSMSSSFIFQTLYNKDKLQIAEKSYKTPGYLSQWITCSFTFDCVWLGRRQINWFTSKLPKFLDTAQTLLEFPKILSILVLKMERLHVNQHL